MYGPKTRLTSQQPTLLIKLVISSSPVDVGYYINDEDLLLWSKLYNHPFFIEGYTIEKVVNCILMDDGLTVNILPLKTMNEIGIPRDELFSIHLTIQSFNQ